MARKAQGITCGHTWRYCKERWYNDLNTLPNFRYDAYIISVAWSTREGFELTISCLHDQRHCLLGQRELPDGQVVLNTDHFSYYSDATLGTGLCVLGVYSTDLLFLYGRCCIWRFWFILAICYFLSHEFVIEVYVRSSIPPSGQHLLEVRTARQ
jgi:hypothetical protein